MNEHAERRDLPGAVAEGSPEPSGQRVTPHPDDLNEALWDGRGIDITPEGPRVADGW